MTKATLVAAALAALMASATSLATAAPLPASAFSYDASAGFDVTVVNRSLVGNANEEEVTFASPRGGRVHALIVSPRNGRKGPGVLFVHWLGDPKTTNYTEFQPDAETLARDGVTSVLVDAMWAQPRWFSKLRTTDTDYDASIKQVIDLRRALDLLLAQPGVDPNRIAYVGHDFGAMYGAVLSGVDVRPRYYVLMAGTSSFAEWYLLGKKPADVQAYVAQMAPLEPLQYLSASKARDFLFQFSQKDEYIAPDRQASFAAAAPVPHATFIYQSTHALAEPIVRADRLRWLRSRLLR